MNYYIFSTAEGSTFQPDSESELPEVENLQVIGFSKGINADKAYKNLLFESPYLKKQVLKRYFVMN